MKKYIESPIAFTLLILAILIAGSICFFNLPIKMYPDMVKPGFRISFGNSDIGIPEEMRKRYGRAIDEQLQKLKGIEKYEVTYYPNWSRIEMEFEWDIDEEKLQQDIENVFIPLKEAERGKFWYNVRSSTSESSGNFMISIGHKTLSGEQLREYLDQTIIRDISKIDQVENVNFWGWQGENIYLELNLVKLLEYGLSIEDIIQSINKSSNHLMAGKLIEGEVEGRKSIQIDIPSSLKDIYQIMDMPLHDSKGNPLSIKIKHIAKIKEEFNRSDSVFRLNGDNATFMSIILKSSGDIKRTCDDIINKIKNFKKDNEDLTYKVIVNPADFVENSMENLLVNAVLGGLVAILIVFLFLGSLANTFIIAISIPFCLISSFILMKLFGISINIISLGGMAIGVGMILDSSIVVLENIWRLKLNKPEASTIEVIIESIKEVSLPIIMSVLTSIVVFMPILFTASYTKAILGDLAKMVIFTLLLSLPAALIVVPVLSHKLMPNNSKNYKFLSIWDKVNLIYTKSLNWLLNKKRRIISFSLVSLSLFIGSLFLFPLVKKEIVAIPATKLLAVRMGLPDNQDLAFTLKKIKEVEAYLKKRQEIKSIATAMWNPDNGYIIATLNSRHDFETVKEDFNKAFPRNPTSNIHAHKWDPGRMPLPNQRDMIISISGENLESIAEASQQLTNDTIPSAKFNFNQRPWKQPSENIQVIFKPWLSTWIKDQAHKLLQVATKNGFYLGEFFSEGQSKQLNLRFMKEQRSKYLEDMRNLPLPINNKIVSLKSLADINFNNEITKPLRYLDGQKSYDIELWVENTKNENEKKVEIDKLKELIKKTQLPGDVNIQYPNPNIEMDKSIDSFKFSLIISIAFVFLVIAVLFNSIKYPIIVIATIPLAVIGVGTGLYLWESTLSLNSMLGTILLCGLVVNNAIILIDFYINQEKSLSVKERIIKAASLRLRPILMSTLTTLLGVFPVALGLGEGGEVLAPLGISIFSGLMFSTVLCLFFIPGLIILFDRKETQFKV